jgi:HEAT repeat protein
MKKILMMLAILIAVGPAATASAQLARPSGGTPVPDVVKGQIGKLASPDPAVRQLAMDTLAALRAEAWPAIDTLLGFFGKPEEELAARTIVAIGEPAVDPLLGKLKDANVDMRIWAAGMLSRIGDPRAKDPLLAALADPNARMAHAAAEALAGMADKGLLGKLSSLLKDPALQVRWAALDALAASRQTDDLASLGAAAKDPSLAVRMMAALAASNAGAPAIEMLAPLVKDADPRVRLCAVVALGRIRDTKAVAPLAEALADKEADIRLQAVRSLGDTGRPEIAGPLMAILLADNAGGIYGEAEVVATMTALGKSGSPMAVSPLIAGLDDSHLAVRQAAASALTALTGQNFKDAADAQRWWKEVKGQLPAPAAKPAPAAEPATAKPAAAEPAVRA